MTAKTKPSTDQSAAKHPHNAETASIGAGRLWMLVIALSLLIASALFLHETTNRILRTGTFFGIVMHARAFTCFANIIGVTLGFALIAIFCRRFAELRRRPVFWAGYFVLQMILVVAFYLTLHPNGSCEMTLLVQLLIGICEPVVLIMAIDFARWIPHRQYAILLVSILFSTVVLVYGILSILANYLSPMACMTVQLAMTAAAMPCAILPLKTAGGKLDDPSLPEFTVSKKTQKQSGSHPLTYLVIILVSYGMVFGFMHVIPTGLFTHQLPRVLPNLVGAALAAGFYLLLLPKTEPTTTLVWNRIFRVAFPCVALAALLIPYTSGFEFIFSLVFSASAEFFFLLLVLTGCRVICRTIGVGYMRLTASVLLLYNIGFTVGDCIAMVFSGTIEMTGWNLGLMSIGIFLLLCFATLNSNADKYAKTAWGIIPKETPQALHKKQTVECCEELARTHNLTGRETETLILLADGLKAKEISEKRVVSIATVRTHIQSVYSKLNVHSAEELRKVIEDSRPQ